MLTFEEWRHTYADVFETDDAARAAWTAACNRGYHAGMQDTRALLAAHSAGAQRVTNIPERQRGESFRDWAKRTYELQDAQPMPQTDAARDALAKLRAAQLCHPNAVQHLIEEAIACLAEIERLDRAKGE